MKKALFFLLITAFISCKKGKDVMPAITDQQTTITLKYVEGFTVTSFETYKVLEIKNPWPKADKIFRYALISEKEASKITLNKDDFEGVITIPMKTLVVTSTTHIPALELLGVEQALVGFPGTDYISSESLRQRIDDGHIRELGKNEGINTEVLLELQPDAVVGFGVDGVNKTFENIKKSGIPVIYNGDWVEASALAKAEWIKFFGVLFNKDKEADSIFNSIEKSYLEAKMLAANVDRKPTVLCGAMHKDVWYLPNGSSPEAQFLKDANVNYLWSETSGSGSLALSFETVFDKGKEASIWLSPSYYTSLEALEKANEHYTRFSAFENKTVFSFSNTTGKTGGVLYYELGMARPDLVLKDIIKICHPNLLPDYEPFFFKPLE